MCGIALIARPGGVLGENELAAGRRLVESMQRRGPDGGGTWVSPTKSTFLGHRRLAVIDLSPRAAQPMIWPERGLAITFNGEIYNYRELRRELEGLGHRFTTDSDTEVILHGYAEWSAEVLPRLRGMFAFAVHDERTGEIFLARDPYGIKPLYYAWDGSRLAVASQVRALVTAGFSSRRPDPAGWVGFLLFGSVPEPWTTWCGIRQLPAGSTMVLRNGTLESPRRYARIAAVFAAASQAAPSTSADVQETVRSAVLDSVRAHLVADVPVGAFLSAGVDSGTLVALMREVGCEDIHTITLGFEEFRGTPEDEVPLAEETARRYGTRHTTRIIGRKEFLDDWPKILQAMDQPSVDGANTWLVSKAAHEAGLKVVVSGVGGDELFGGYPSFRQIPRWMHTMRRIHAVPLASRSGYLLARGAARLSTRVPRKLPAVFRYANTYEGAYFARRGLFMPWELEGVLEPDFARAGLREFAPLEWIGSTLDSHPVTDLGQVMALESSIYLRNQLLRDADWAGMDHSLELRTPLVDWHLWCTLAPTLAMRETPGKAPLAGALAGAVPTHWSNRSKTGFGLPLASWWPETGPKRSQSRKGPASVSHAIARNLAQHSGCNLAGATGVDCG